MKRRQFTAQFKFQVALDALRGMASINEVASEHEVHPTQVKQWKKQLQEQGAELFNEKADKAQRAQAETETVLYEQIAPSGHPLKMELEWLKKKVT